MFFWNSDDYLLVVDYYSRFWEIFKVSSTKSSAIITKMKTLLARHGVPEVLKSDNGPQYSSRNEQLQQHETTEVNHETLSSAGGTASPVKTRSGRIIRRPVRYKDYI